MAGAATGRPRGAWERQEAMASQRPEPSLTPVGLATCWSSTNTGNLFFFFSKQNAHTLKSKKKAAEPGKTPGRDGGALAVEMFPQREGIPRGTG